MASHKVVIDVIKPFCPGVYTFLFQVDQLIAEATPETGLAVATDPTGVELRLSVTIRHLMRFGQVFVESLSSVTYLGACTTFRSLFIASPSLQVEVLRIFMTLPKVLLQVKKVQP
jgi:hypothetical protein